MAKYKDYPIYTYDEPATYADFSGGINTHPSNEHLLKNEMRDCLNMTYKSGALVKRDGARFVARLQWEDSEPKNIQGLFLFTYKITYVIAVANGNVYGGAFSPNGTIRMTRIPIDVPYSYTDLAYDPTNQFADLPQEWVEKTDTKQEGYILTRFFDTETQEYLQSGFGYRGNFASIRDLFLYPNDVFEYGDSHYVYLQNENLRVKISKRYAKSGTVMDSYEYAYNATQDGGGDYLYEYADFANLINNKAYFHKLNTSRELILQNYRKVEAATFKNKLIIATGTRVIEVSLKNGILCATPITPYEINASEYINIGVNRMSPYPELCRASQRDTVSTSMEGIRVDRLHSGFFRLTPLMNFQAGDKPTDYFYKWEKRVAGQWLTIIPFDIQKELMGVGVSGSFHTIEVDDADLYQYRCTFARAFTDGYTPCKIIEYEDDGDVRPTGTIKDYEDVEIDKVTGEYFGSATSVLHEDYPEVDDTYRIIQSCSKILADGEKLLLYGDSYNSGLWFKTVIGNPGYITDRGSLSFKTTKNEELVKAVPFQGNIVCFANSRDVGGSIHIVKGNGDDYDSQDGYYSPYRRSIVNASVSCDNAETVQICDNLIVFKYFDRVYEIDASEMDNEVVRVTPCNDRLLAKSVDVDIPWDDNGCVSEATQDHYALIWPEKYSIDKYGDPVLEHPAMRVKMYYKISNQIPDGSYVHPWLRDESDFLNISAVMSVKGRPVYLKNGLLFSFEGSEYGDMEEEFPCKIRTKGYDCGYPQMFKILDSVQFYYHRNQYSKVSFKAIVRNEAGHQILTEADNEATLQDAKAIIDGTRIDDDQMRVDSTTVDTRILNVGYRFPFQLADVTVITSNKGAFSLSSVTFRYQTMETPDSMTYDLYSKILRPEDLK